MLVFRRALAPLLACLALATVATGCDGCTKAGRLRVSGDHPYVRCMTVDEPAPRRLQQLRRQTDALTTPRPVFELALQWLHDHAPGPAPTVLVHGDFRLGNLMVDAQGLRARRFGTARTQARPIAAVE